MNRDERDRQRREQDMLRRLEELDRLDALAQPDEVAWPTRTPSPPRPGRRGARTITAVVVAALAVGGWYLGPSLPGWVDYLVHGDPDFRYYDAAANRTANPAPAAPVTGGRVRPAVPLPDPPPDDRYAWIATQADGTPVRFDPCEAVHYVVRTRADVPPEAQEALSRAVASVAAASGLAFVFDGYTEEVPTDERGRGRSLASGAAPPVLLAWTDPVETPALDGPTLGDGGPLFAPGRDGRDVSVSGQVRLDTVDLLRDITTPEGQDFAQSVIMHELGHVLGAGHSQSDDELMAERTDGRTSLGEGDRYAFAVLGGGPCEGIS